MENTPNLLIRKDSKIFYTEQKIENNDINNTLLNLDFIKENSVIHIRASRGCVFKCAFCSYSNNELALMDIENVILILKKCKDKNVKSVYFVDDTFNYPQDRFEKLLDRMIEEKINIPWFSFLRCQFVNERIVHKMKRSGCEGVLLGIESGSDRVLKNMNKGAISKFYKESLKWLKEQNIITVGAFVIGFPGENHDTILETKDFIENSKLDFYFLQPFFYLHHTPIYNKAKDYNLVGQGMFWKHDTMNSKEAFDIINKLFTEIKGSTFLNPKYALWEISYLLYKGFNYEEIKEICETINVKTLNQMTNHNLI